MGARTAPEFEEEVIVFFRMDVLLPESEGPRAKEEQKIYTQYEQTKELVERLGEYEQEIYEKDLLIQHLQKETGIHGETFEK